MTAPRDIAARLRIKADMITMGEKIEWGSDAALMHEAAAVVEELERERDAAIGRHYMVCLMCSRPVDERTWRAIGLPAGAVRCPCGARGQWARGHSHWKARLAALEDQNRALRTAVKKLGLEELVAGWHSRPGYDRHHDELGVTLPTNASTVYAIADALASIPGEA